MTPVPDLLLSARRFHGGSLAKFERIKAASETLRRQGLVARHPGTVGGRCCAQGLVQRRAYLGEYWDYHVILHGASDPLRVTTRAQDVFQMGEAVFVEIDTTQLTVIRPPF